MCIRDRALTVYAAHMNWAYQRTNPFDDGTPALRDCWDRSATLIAKLKTEFEQAGIVDRVRTVYVAGSLGRMEAVPSSDCDIVVVLSESDRASNQAKQVVDAVFDCVSRTGFQRPKTEGIFGSATSFEQLLDDATAGQVDEDLAVFGKRIQALLDSQPLVHDDEFASLQQLILKRYASAPRADPDAFELGWLMDDLIRYWRSLCSRTRWLCHDQTIQWRALNVKVRHSRMLLCAGLSYLLWDVAGAGNVVEQLSDRLKLVPLERVRCSEVTAEYETFMAAMTSDLKKQVSDADTFAQLIANGAKMSEAVGQRLAERFGTQVAATLFGELR